MIPYYLRRVPARRPRRRKADPYGWTGAQIVCVLAYAAFLGLFILLAAAAHA